MIYFAQLPTDTVKIGTSTDVDRRMKGSPEYVRRLDAAHEKTHIPKVQIFRLAMQDWDSKNGLPAPPEI